VHYPLHDLQLWLQKTWVAGWLLLSDWLPALSTAIPEVQSAPLILDSGEKLMDPTKTNTCT
jgi:hypothetical protein